MRMKIALDIDCYINDGVRFEKWHHGSLQMNTGVYGSYNDNDLILGSYELGISLGFGMITL